MPIKPYWAIPLIAAGIFLIAPFVLPVRFWEEDISVAFLGNSVLYYNDLPRLMQAISGGHITQNSCLNSDATVSNMWEGGNGMYPTFKTANALIRSTISTSKYIHDYGACSTQQLLLGADDRIYDDNFDDGTNPCTEENFYLYYTMNKFQKGVEWDFVVMNDETQGPARRSSREASLQELESSFALWFNETGSIPVFLSTHAYWTEFRDMSGLEDIPTFTSLTYEGCRQYALLMADYLPPDRQPRIAPVGIAFLLIWEENYGMWQRLFAYDQVHLSPHGTYLYACVLHYTLYGHMPQASVAVREDMAILFFKGRFKQPYHSLPIPDREDATYLYGIAGRVMAKKVKPKSLILYQNGEAVEDEEQDGDSYYTQD